uniref:Uncharacterized protein n=1 Tax=viral metagenome TaxID=1070528 RepID=A0A6C0AFM8_9ZZZZ
MIKNIYPPTRYTKEEKEKNLYFEYILFNERFYEKYMNKEINYEEYILNSNEYYKKYKDCQNNRVISLDELCEKVNLNNYSFFKVLDEKDIKLFLSKLSREEISEIYFNDRIKLHTWVGIMSKIKVHENYRIHFKHVINYRRTIYKIYYYFDKEDTDKWSFFKNKTFRKIYFDFDDKKLKIMTFENFSSNTIDSFEDSLIKIPNKNEYIY